MISTRNRAGLLGDSIASVLQQRTEVPFELIVVDNGSTDGTRDLVRRHGEAVIRYVHEPVAGLARARNTGWRHARGAIVALIDDDALADTDWLSALVEAFKTVQPTPACVGGRVSPLFESPRPAWLIDRLLPALTVVDWGPAGHRIEDPTREWLVGANVAFSRRALEYAGGFPEVLGRRGSSLLSGEETFVQRRLLAGGMVCWYEPRAHVRHRIPAERQTPDWFCRRHYSQGLSDGIMWRLDRATHRQSRIRRIAIEARALAGAALAIARSRPATESEAIEARAGLWWRVGLLAALVREP